MVCINFIESRITRCRIWNCNFGVSRVDLVIGDEMLDDGRILFLGDRDERCCCLFVALLYFFYGLYKFGTI